MTSTLSIDDLYTDNGIFDEQAVLQALHQKVVFTKNNDILFTSDPTILKPREVILLFALAKKVLKFHSKIEVDIITNAEVIAKTKVNKNTINVNIMRLKDKKLLISTGAGYEIPMFKVGEALAILKEIN